VRAVADDIKVKLVGSHDRSDGEIAASAADHLKWSTSITDDKVDITVRDGWITLTGQLEVSVNSSTTRQDVINVVFVRVTTFSLTVGF
jgi:hypothetical protein